MLVWLKKEQDKWHLQMKKSWGQGLWSVPNQRSVVLSVSISGADGKA